MAEFEREQIRERTIAGMDAACAAGRRSGRPPALDAERIAAAQRMLDEGRFGAGDRPGACVSPSAYTGTC